MLGEFTAEIARSGRKIDKNCTLWQLETLDRNPAPTNVEAKGHDPIHQVIARCNRVEHCLNRLALGLATGELLVERWQTCVGEMRWGVRR